MERRRAWSPSDQWVLDTLHFIGLFDPQYIWNNWKEWKRNDGLLESRDDILILDLFDEADVLVDGFDSLIKLSLQFLSFIHFLF